MNKLLFLGFFLTLTLSGLSLPIEKQDLVNFKGNQTCETCEKLVGFITLEEKHLNKTITDIIVLLRDICSNIEGPSGKECVIILDNIEKIIKWITSGLSPTTICHRLGFCNTTMLSRPCISEL